MKTIKRLILCWMLTWPACDSCVAQSIDPVSLIIAKAIKAIDLQVQRLQNKTLWLQQAQQVAEHELSKLKLQEITDLQNRSQALYADYFKELSAVRAGVKGLAQVKQIVSMQAQVMTAYNRVAKEPAQVARYNVLLALSKDILASMQDLLSTKQFVMKDADRILLLARLRDAMGECLDGIHALNCEQIRVNANKERMKSDLRALQDLNKKL